jgi:hypothetical protein
MAQYSVRIELHSASDTDYDLLHKGMKRAGFKRFVLDDGNKMYLLPTGSYIIDTSDSLQDTFTKAKTAADSTGRNSSIWMVQWTAARFILKEITKDPDA